MKIKCRLKMLPSGSYIKAGPSDPIKFYRLPFIGSLYRRRIELCLSELTGGNRILEVGFGSGVTFLNLSEKYEEIHGLDLDADIETVSGVFEKLKIKTILRNGNVLNMPYQDGYFDSVLLISILEHLGPDQQEQVFKEIARVVKDGGQVIYGAPVYRPFMKFLFWVLGYDIGKLHLSTEKQIFAAAEKTLKKVKMVEMRPPLLSSLYEIGHFVKYKVSGPSNDRDYAKK
ncbi:MAG: class I SAM-dependent methyltransferase [Candidatus Omnitrophota bacterium]|nr:class I SAM-dependent methyltransferase [Candidatus Omnitrophota bacterium]